MNHIEIEYKTLLTPDRYQQLLPLFEGISPVQQSNYYFDSPENHMKKAKMALRIRTYEDWAELTLKIPQANSIGNLEINQTLTLVEAQAILSGDPLPEGQILSILKEKAIPTKELACLGSLTTVRLERQHSLGLMALDKSHYFDQTDYELEVEVADETAGKLAFSQFLEEYGISYQQAPSKLARFAKNL